MRASLGIALSLLVACGGGDGGDDSSGAVDAPALDAPAGPSTDPSSPTPLPIGTTVSATFSGTEHYFIFTAGAAGVYTTSFTGPASALANHCEGTGGCICALGSNCCVIEEGETACTYVVETTFGAPLDAGEVVYPVVNMPTGVTGDYTLRIDGPG